MVACRIGIALGFFMAAACLVGTGGTEMASLAQRPGEADFVFRAGRIWTGDSEHPWAESLAARDGKVLAVGDWSEIEKLRGPTTRTLELPDSFATPGLIDAHGHLSGLGEALEQIDLRDVTSIEEVARRVREQAESARANEWILGHGWDQSLWPGKELPTHAALSQAVPDRPVFLRRVDGHAVWINSAALKVAGITITTSDPPGGKILRDSEGHATGVLLDSAVDLLARHMPQTSPERLRRQYLRAQRVCIESGLTGVHDAGLSSLDIEVLRELDKSGELELRVYGMASPPAGREVAFVSQPPPRSSQESRFVLRAIKMFIDGAMGSRGAALHEDYSDDPGNRGLILTDPALLEQITEAALTNGWQVCTHAIGDRGNRLVLDAYAQALRKVPARDPRLRIEHAQVVNLTDIPRFAKTGVIASMQPTHATTDKRWAEDRVGPQRVAGAYAWRRFLDSGARLAFGSDFPVEKPDPLLGLYAAVTRQDVNGEPADGWQRDQRVTIDEALRGFTSGSAFASFDEHRLGMLKPRMQCDITVFDRDLTRIAASEIPLATVQVTVIAGRIVHRF